MSKLRNFILVLLVFPFFLTNGQEIKFDEYFSDQTMRIDYFHIGDAKTEIVTIDRIYKYGIFAGSRKNLLDNFDNGAYYYKIFDAEKGTLIYSKGFDSYFKEYQTSGEAADGIKRTYHETSIIPFPKNKIKFTLNKRDKYNKLNEVFSTIIDPNDVMIVKDPIIDNSVIVYESLKSGDPHKKLDVVIVGEGYTKEETEKFKNDVDRFTKVFTKKEPYTSLKNDFNIYGVLKPSAESGVDEPRANIFRNTSVNATFNSLGSERYLLTEDNKSLRDIAAHVPYDAVYVMVNHARYGGGGIYNFYCTFTADNQFHEYLFIHEFGHSFAGLADEYYTSSTSYNDFYPAGVEPVEPNITRLLDPKNIKWNELVKEGTELPTPWEKEDFDKTDYKWQKERTILNNGIAELKRNGASKEEIKKAEENYNTKDMARTNNVSKYLAGSKYVGVVGAFEGAGYSSTGLYRPMLDCIMFTKTDGPFCKVCEQAIAKVIKHYTED